VKTNKTILVTWDFTKVSENAFLHALKMARNVEQNIRLLHVVKEDKDLKTAEERIRKDVSRLSSEHNLTVESVILKGSIFKQISEYAMENEEASIIVMGTHGMKGSQKYFGSYALRVIIGSPTPFVVVQQPPENMNGFSNIVFPIDFKSENKEKLQWAIFMGKYFSARVHLFKSPITDKSLAKKVNINLNFAIRFLIQNNLDYEIHTSRKKGSFNKEMMNFAKEVKSDMVLITTTKHITMLDYLFGAPEQYIMANPYNIPIMVVNPKASFSKVGQFMYGN
jgi:nucleotide-binding universal stress UspA family protein